MNKSYILFLLTIFSIGIINAQKKSGWLYKPGVAANFASVIHSDDPSAFKNIVFIKQEVSSLFDRRVDAKIAVNAYIFNITWKDGITTKIMVNPNVGDFNKVTEQATKHAKIVGLLPYCLRSLLDEIILHDGNAAFGGGNRSLLFYTSKTIEHETKTGKLNEIVVHEAAHNLAQTIDTSPEWLAVQKSDSTFISKYAHDYPEREDISESFLAWFIFRYHRDRIADNQVKAIMSQIPARLKYFDSKNYNMNPICK
ncbi:hypothetical protein [Elizabethkingia anophelis]|uniref:hypothetical protein n=1 Tax=Elizabethkingia anophelis TaxID=1117645 RepID=UPI0038925247